VLLHAYRGLSAQSGTVPWLPRASPVLVSSERGCERKSWSRPSSAQWAEMFWLQAHALPTAMYAPALYHILCLSNTFLQSRELLRLCRAGAGAYVAAMRRAAAHFHLAQLAAGAGALHAAVNALLPRLPGAAIAACEP
jgi:hypothetical protein